MARTIGTGVLLLDQFDNGEVLQNAINNNAELLAQFLAANERGEINITGKLNAIDWDDVNLATTGLYEQTINTPLVDPNDANSALLMDRTMLQFSETAPDTGGLVIDLSYESVTHTSYKVFSNRNIDYTVLYIQ